LIHTFKGADQRVIQVAAGATHALVLTEEDGVYSCGNYSYGQTGLPGAEPAMMQATQSDLLPIATLRSEKIIQISCGGYHSMALNDKGEVFSWGAGEYGQLGQPGRPHRLATPTRIDALRDVQVSFIACGASHSIALSKDGQVRVLESQHWSL
jgi:alpha-tubulin suppressor-like RCC1 family protein